MILVIGAWGANSAYIIFGHKATWLASVGLSTVNGTNGVKFIGTGDSSGWSVSGAGDINGDNIADLMIGAYTANSNTGRSYAVLGDSSGRLQYNTIPLQEGGSIVLNNTYLNATYNNVGPANVELIVSNLHNGWLELVSQPGVALSNFTQLQINTNQVRLVHDGSCFGSAYQISANTGKLAFTYPVSANIAFLPIYPLITSNSLTVNQGQTIVLTPSNLNVTDPGDVFSNLRFNLSSIQHGKFSLTSSPTIPITQFTQAQVNSGSVQFASDGTAITPDYIVSVQDNCGLNSISQIANINFNVLLSLVNNHLSVGQGQTVVLNSTNLSAVDAGDFSASLLFSVSNIQHGQFTLVISPSISIVQFYQANITSSAVQFIHDGSNQAPSYNVQAKNSNGLTSLTQPASITFDVAPVLVNNQLTVIQGQPVILSSSNLSATDIDNPLPTLSFIISNAQHGHFEFTSHLGATITTFLQQDISNGRVQFIQDDTTTAPSYSVSVSDGTLNTTPQASTITFTDRPLLLNNQLLVNQGQPIIISSNNLSASDTVVSAGNLQFTVSNVKHGQFEYASNPGVAIISFRQSDITSSSVRFIPDNSRSAPSYNVVVSNGVLSDGPYAAAIIFNDIPLILNNQLNINQGQTVVLTTDNFNATDEEIPTADILFITSNVQHGHFEMLSNLGSVINSFYQKNISVGNVQFIHDGSIQAPSYSTAVSNGILSSSPSAALITFNSDSNSNSSPDNTVRNSIIGGTISGGMGLFFFLLKIYLEKKANEYINNQTQKDDFREKVVIPIAKEISSQIKISGFLGYVSEDTTRAYVSAIIEIIHELQKRGVDVGTEMKGDPARTRFLNQITRQTRLCILGESACCSCATISNFFCPEIILNKLKIRLQ